MGMPETGTTPKYVIKPKRRWLAIPLFVLTVAVTGAPIWLDLWQGHHQEKMLLAEMEAVRKRGEPIFVEDFAAIAQSVKEEDNAALLLRAAGRAVNASHISWEKFDDDKIELLEPLSDETARVVAEVLDVNRDALRRLREARGRAEVYWPVAVKRPLSEMPMPDWQEQKALANLSMGDIAYQHYSGLDSAALERARDMLRMSAAMEEMPLGLSHLIAVGMSAMAAENLVMMAPALRIGESGGAASKQQVRMVIAELLDERAMAEGLRRSVRWSRMEQVDGIRSLQEGKTREGLNRVQSLVIRDDVLEQARLVLERWNEVVALTDSGLDWPSCQRALKVQTRVMGEIKKSRMGMALVSTPDYGPYLERQHSNAAMRRMAATALAIRLYAMEHEGRLPEKLQELVPAYLLAVPMDPMAEAGKAIGYVADPSRPVLYSVGTNGTDEGGSEKAPAKIVEPTRWSREDAVVHLRRKHGEFRPKPTQFLGTFEKPAEQ
jgi:hypothetical protein